MLEKTKFNGAKERMIICWGFIRELRHWEIILEDSEFYQIDYGLIYSRVLHLRYHINRYFSDELVEKCKAMFADRQNDFDPYKNANWVHRRAIVVWGAGIEVWRRAARVENIIKYRNFDDIPF